LSRCSGCSESAMSLSMDFFAKSWLGRTWLRHQNWKQELSISTKLAESVKWKANRASSTTWR